MIFQQHFYVNHFYVFPFFSVQVIYPFFKKLGGFSVYSLIIGIFIYSEWGPLWDICIRGIVPSLWLVLHLLTGLHIDLQKGFKFNKVQFIIFFFLWLLFVTFKYFLANSRSWTYSPTDFSRVYNVDFYISNH